MNYKMSDNLTRVSYEIRGPNAAEAERMSQKGIKIVKLNTGNPSPFGFHAPDSIAYFHTKSGIKGVGPEDIYTGNGVSELISMTMLALLNSGDEILIPAPDYPLWTAAATMSGGTVVHYQCDESAGWHQ